MTYTLLGDGSSDRLLDFPIQWALRTLGIAVESTQWADLGNVKPRPSTLTERARVALELYPAELLVVHRDAESSSLEERLEEVRIATQGLAGRHVAVVPVRMTEAWLLHDEQAIRRASGNPNGTVALSLPSAARVESDVNPKATLETALLTASELKGRRRQRRKAEFSQMRARTAGLIRDFTPLEATPSFAAFLSALRAALVALGRLERGER
ncbi:MAG: hypothetical protein IT374_19440 [Polyangiaceae bacterium]|nr:hypothetical protein [Polyangiaceae bacterium]